MTDDHESDNASAHDQAGDPSGSMHHVSVEDDPVDVRAPFTRRSFIAAAGVTAAGVTMASTAKAASDPVHSGSILRIHPAIGFARLGNAESDSFFVGPEVPGYAPVYDGVGTPVPDYKVGGLIKPQAARFRIYEYHYVDGALTPKREVALGTDGVANIVWSVHLANKKASFHGFDGGKGESSEPAPLRNASVTDPALRRSTLEIDFGPRSIGGPSSAARAFTPATVGDYDKAVPLAFDGSPIIDYLGELRTDPDGRLLVIPGKGNTGYNTENQPPMPHWANNDGWFDDASDGPVTAVVILEDGTSVGMDAAGHAWVMCGPPDFAPGVPGSVTAYDLLLDVAVRALPLPEDAAAYLPGGPLQDVAELQAMYEEGAAYEFPAFTPHFGEHIQPILIAAYNLWWVNSLVTAKHDSLIKASLGSTASKHAKARSRVFSYMRPPLGVPSGNGPRTMPKILGDDPYLGNLPDAVKNLALTHVQFGMLRRWADGNFTEGSYTPPFELTAHGLDRAALENAVGGAFFPGIEFGWQLRNPSLFIEPFRLNPAATSGFWGEDEVPVGPGHFSRQMAVPWQADFNDCRNEGNYAWWPTQRPSHALPSPSARSRLDWARPDDRFEGGNRESTHEDMVQHWSKFGFVLEEGDSFVEKERAAHIP